MNKSVNTQNWKIGLKEASATVVSVITALINDVNN